MRLCLADVVVVPKPRQISLMLSVSDLVFGKQVKADGGHDDTQYRDDERKILNRKRFVSGASGRLKTHKVK